VKVQCFLRLCKPMAQVVYW